MGKVTGIQWCDHTFNAWWGCHKVSAGCAHCYAETFSKRFHSDIWGRDGRRRMMGEDYWREPLAWNRAAQAAGVRRRVFSGSMCDVFEDDFKLKTTAEMVRKARYRLFILIRLTPHLDWLLLTKRPENVSKLVPSYWMTGKWPLNAWMGTSVENQDAADKRIPILLGLPAPIRFLSCEPLLGGVDLDRICGPSRCRCSRWSSSTDR